MSYNLKESEERPHLRLLPSAERTATNVEPVAPSLASAPFRPGELPLTAWIPLSHPIRELVSEQANAASLPVELWVRIAVEASRLATEIASLTACPREEVIRRLDLAASEPEREVHVLGASDLCRYAAELCSGHWPTSATGEVLALRLPEEIRGAWNTAASEARLGIAHWVAAELEKAPLRCVDWEAAAARTSRSLGEWAYASWLRTSARAKA